MGPSDSFMTTVGLWAPTHGKLESDGSVKTEVWQDTGKKERKTPKVLCVSLHMCLWGNTPTYNVKGHTGWFHPKPRPVLISLSAFKCFNSTSGLGYPQCLALIWISSTKSLCEENTSYHHAAVFGDVFSKMSPSFCKIWFIQLFICPTIHPSTIPLSFQTIYLFICPTTSPSIHPSIHPLTQHSFMSLGFHCAPSLLPSSDALPS